MRNIPPSSLYAFDTASRTRTSLTSFCLLRPGRSPSWWNSLRASVQHPRTDSVPTLILCNPIFSPHCVFSFFLSTSSWGFSTSAVSLNLALSLIPPCIAHAYPSVSLVSRSSRALLFSAFSCCFRLPGAGLPREPELRRLVARNRPIQPESLSLRGFLLSVLFAAPT